MNISEKAIQNLSFDKALRYLVQQASQQKIQIFLLIDEPEDVLFKFAESDPSSLKKLHTSMLQGKALRTVITSGPRLRALNDLGWQTSPFWEGFDRSYIGAIERNDAVNIIRQTQSNQPISVPDELVNLILERTGQIPWLIQSVCREIEPIPGKSQVPNSVWSTHDYDDRFKTDYRMLLEGERRILRSIGGAHKSPLNIDEIVQDCNMSEAQVLPALFRLKQLGYIQDIQPELYSISNHFLKEWLRLGLWQKYEKEMALASRKGLSSSGLSTIFVSYSHKDEMEKDALLSHLGVLEGAGLIDLWSDDRISVGTDWRTEISQAITKAQVAILLVSANFLTSKFILQKEIPELLKRRDREDIAIFPVIAKACAWKTVDWLAKMNVRPKNGNPVWSDGGSHVNKDLAAIAEEVAVIIKRGLPEGQQQQSRRMELIK